MPHVFDPNEADGLYGDISTLEASIIRGDEQVNYQEKCDASDAWLSRYTGPTDTTTMEPEMLAELPPEEG